MHILVEAGDYRLRNIGDLAMLQIAVQRLQRLFPDAQVEVFASTPELAGRYLPGARAIDPTGHLIWSQAFTLLGGWRRLLPTALVHRIEAALRQNYPDWAYHRARRVLRHKWPDAAEALTTYYQAIRRADLVVAAGGGYITDAFSKAAAPILETLRLAQRMGKSTAMLGQGLGPVNDERLVQLLRQVLPHNRLLTVREARVGGKLAEQYGARPETILCSGDDAIELALDESPAMGHAIGVNLRLSKYAGVSESDAGANILALRKALESFGREINAPLLPVPISRHAEEDDVQNAGKFLGLDEAELKEARIIYTPGELVKQVKQCRLVVTGSYHAGVFALSQGIPVLALVGSHYYADKFTGLAQQFPGGCEVITLDAPNFAQAVATQMRRLWNDAPALHPTLITAARQQVALAHKAYQRLVDIVGGRHAASSTAAVPADTAVTVDPDETPAISVLMPVYNAQKYLSEAVTSILAQTDPDFELIAVDDGSSDNSLAILKQFAAQDSRVHIISRPNTGIVGALNDALAAARAPLAARMDADDVAMPTRFEKQWRYMDEHPECVSIGSGAIVTEANGVPLYTWDRPAAHERIDAMLLSGDGAAMIHPATMTRTAAMREVGGYRRQYQYAEDLDLWLRLAEVGRLANLDEPLLRYRQHLQSINHQHFSRQRAIVQQIIRDAAQRRGIPPVSLGAMHQLNPLDRLEMWTWACLRAGRSDIARRHALRRLRMAPLSMRSWKLIAFTSMGQPGRSALHFIKRHMLRCKAVGPRS